MIAPVPPKPGRGYRLIFRASYTRNGITYYARDYGYRAWPLWIRVS